MSHYVLVQVIVPDTSGEFDIEHEYVVDFADHTARRWISRTTQWALNHERGILSEPFTGDITTRRIFRPREPEEVRRAG